MKHCHPFCIDCLGSHNVTQFGKQACYAVLNAKRIVVLKYGQFIPGLCPLYEICPDIEYFYVVEGDSYAQVTRRLSAPDTFECESSGCVSGYSTESDI